MLCLLTLAYKASVNVMLQSASNTFDLTNVPNISTRTKTNDAVDAENYLSICDVDSQINVTERPRSNFSDKLVFSTDYEFGF